MAGDYFRFWDSYIDALDRVDDATAGRLVKALCHMVFRGEPQDFSDAPTVGMVYDVMLGQATNSRDISRAARENGARGGRPRKGSKRVAKGSLKGRKSEQIREDPRGKEPNRREGSFPLTRPDLGANPALGGWLTPPPAPEEVPPPAPDALPPSLT